MINVAFMELEEATPQPARTQNVSGWLATCRRFQAIESRLIELAEAMAALSARRSRHHRRSSASWTAADEAAFDAYLADLRQANAGYVSTLLQELAAAWRAERRLN